MAQRFRSLNVVKAMEQLGKILPPPPQPLVVGIRPLIWEDIGSGFSRAPAPLFGNIRVEKYGELFTTCYSLPGYSNTFAEGAFASADEAKAACEAEYQKRMRVALNTEAEVQANG
jgi:hypothetical protein